MADDLARTVTVTHDLMVKPSTWAACQYAGAQHCPCERVCSTTQRLLGDGVESSDAAQLDKLEEEVCANGFEKVLNTGMATTPRLRDVAAQKNPLPENQRPDGRGAIWNNAEILSILLYTSSDVQGPFRSDMMVGAGRWPVLAATIERALKKQNEAGTTVKENHFACDHVVYHGLHGVNVKDFASLVENDGTFAMTFSIGTVVSASYSRDVSLLFAAGAGGTAAPDHSKGLLLEICCLAHHWPASADVEWCSKFPHEKELIIAPWQHFDPRVGNTGAGAAMTPRSKDGLPATSVAEAVAALESRTDTIALEFMLVALGDSQPPLQTAEDWAAEKAEAEAEGKDGLSRRDVEAFPFLRSKAGDFVLAFRRVDDAGNKGCLVHPSRWRLAIDLKRKRKGWVRSARLQPIKLVEVQVIKVDLRVPSFEECVRQPQIAEGEPPAPRYCKKCKAVFHNKTCAGSHPNFLYTKKIPDGALQEAEPNVPNAHAVAKPEPELEPEPQPEEPELELQPVPGPAPTLSPEVPSNPSVPLTSTLTEPLCYLSLEQETILRVKGLDDMVPELPGWVSQERVSRALFGERGAQLVVDTAEHIGTFVWATEFANVHSTFTFSEPPITVDGEQFSGPEAYFQLQKSFGTPSHDAAKAAMKAITDPIEAWGVGRAHDLRADWDQAKVEVMRTAIRAKFTQSTELRELLLSTGAHPLVQLKPDDQFWGSGRNGRGQNMLGVLLMELRDELKQLYQSI
eukprot:COSAG02_NODE_346_length_24113_cov_13.213001_19_plen_740_part_00